MIGVPLETSKKEKILKTEKISNRRNLNDTNIRSYWNDSDCNRSCFDPRYIKKITNDR